MRVEIELNSCCGRYRVFASISVHNQAGTRVDINGTRGGGVVLGYVKNCEEIELFRGKERLIFNV